MFLFRVEKSKHVIGAVLLESFTFLPTSVTSRLFMGCVEWLNTWKKKTLFAINESLISK